MATTVRDTVVSMIREVLAYRGRSAGELPEAAGLFADGLGLDSLDFATVVVRLEQQTGIDPFRSGQVSRPPATLAQLIALYEQPSGDPPGQRGSA